MALPPPAAGTAVTYRYDNAILGTQSTVNGAAHNYRVGPPLDGTWRYSGDLNPFRVDEADPLAVNFNGDFPNNEEVPDTVSVATNPTIFQTVTIGGVQTAVIYDFSFVVEDAAGNSFTVAVIDADLDADEITESPGEDGYFLVFVGSVPPANTNLTVTNGVTNNVAAETHATLGGVTCFAAGSLIQTSDGFKPVETLRPGDFVQTLSNGLQAIRWISERRVSGFMLAQHENFRPIRVSAGSLGPNQPASDLVLSQQHRVLVNSPIIKRMFGSEEMLVPVKALTELEGIDVLDGLSSVTYWHFLLDQHDVVWGNGARVESLYPGPISLKSFSDSARSEVLRIIPQLQNRDYTPESALPFISVGKMRQSVKRHKKNNVALCLANLNDEVAQCC